MSRRMGHPKGRKSGLQARLALGIDDIASMYKYNMILTNSDADDGDADGQPSRWDYFRFA